MKKLVIVISFILISFVYTNLAMATLFLVWVQSSAITKVVCVDGAVNASNLMDPGQYVVLTASLAADIIKGEAPAKPILMTGEQLEELQRGLEGITGTTES